MSSGSDLGSAEARWRNYQQLIWSQQQIHFQIQQQQLQNSKGGEGFEQAQPPNMDKSVEEKTKELADPWETFDAHAALIGTNVWDKRVPFDGQDFKLEYVDLEEFLTENGIPVEENGKGGPTGYGGPPPNFPQGQGFGMGAQLMAGPSRPHPPNFHTMSQMKEIGLDYAPLSPSPSNSSTVSSRTHDITPAVSPDSTQQAGDVGQGSVPGHEFDPRRRAFTEDELKPQPMIKKSRKQFVPDDAKDAKYWVRRRKNNMAAKRSRDARRVKENQIAMRACYLEKENQFMKQELERIQKENMQLKEELSRYGGDQQQG